MAYKTLVDFPGFPTGTQLTLNGDHYQAPGGLWFHRAVVENDGDRQFREVLTPFVPAQGETYWYIGEAGVVQSATYNNNATHNARIAYGNYFRTQLLALAIRNRIEAMFDEHEYLHGVR